MKINFAYPEFGVGFHSGWCELNNSPTQNLTLSYRRKVNLLESEYKIINRDKNYLPPFFIKLKEGLVKGISSGAGSTIIFYKNKYFKIKRNGYKNKGFVNNNIPDRGFSVLDNSFMEKTDFEIGGAMSLEDATNEIKYEKLIENLGIFLPQKTVGLYKIKLPFEKDDAVAMIQEIQSDFRADEFLIAILINSFYDFYGEDCKLILEKKEFVYPEYDIQEGLNSLMKIFPEVTKIGKIIGGVYRKFHDKGYLRGIGNSWYGNEVICPNGEISVCDLESCFSKKEVGGEKVFRELCLTDLNLAKTAFYDSMNYFENSLASIFGSWLVKSFDEGYTECYEGKLDLKFIEETIDKFIKIKDKVIVYD